MIPSRGEPLILDTVASAHEQYWIDTERRGLVREMVSVMTQRGIAVDEITLGEEVDVSPGSNRYLTLGFLGIADEHRILAEHAPNVNVPNTVAVEEIKRGEPLPEPPFVVKNTFDSGGVNKVFAENDNSMPRIRSWAETLSSEVAAGYVVQEYINTPSARFTSYRVTALPDGTIIGAEIIYSQADVGAPRVTRPELRPLVEPDSPYFVGDRFFVSNMFQGGGQIMLSTPTSEAPPGKQRTLETDKILEEHGIDPETRKSPPHLVEAATKIAQVLGPHRGLILGLDLLQAQREKLYYQETNVYPGLEGIGEYFGDVNAHPLAVFRYAGNVFMGTRQGSQRL